MIEEKENSKTTLVIERRLLSTPFRPSKEVMNEIAGFLSRCLDCRSYPMTKQFLEDVSVVREFIEFLMLTRSIRIVALSIEDMTLKVILTDDLTEGDVKLSQPIIALKPLSAEAKLILTIETTGENPRQTGTLLRCKQRMKVLTLDLKGKTNSITVSLEEIFYEILPKLGLRTTVGNEELDSLSNILGEYPRDVKAITLAVEEIQVCIPASFMQDPEKIKSYPHLLAEIPSEIKEWDIGILTDVEIDNDSWVRTVGNPRKQVALGPVDDRGQLIHYTLRRRK